MDDMRRQLEELMSSVGSGPPKPKCFTEQSVCKHYISGLCPHLLFHNTKLYMGECRYMHSDELKEEYIKEREKKYFGYEEDSIRYMKPVVDECDKKIAKQLQERGEDVDQVKTSIQTSGQREIDSLDKAIQTNMEKAQQLGSSGNVDESMKLMEEVSEQETQKKKLESDLVQKLEETRNMWFQKLKPCEICGALLSERDDESRLNEHFSGRIHLGFEAIRQQMTSLQEYIKRGKLLPRASVPSDPSLPPPTRKPMGGSGGSGGSGDFLYSREDYLRDREKERERERELRRHSQQRERYHESWHRPSRSSRDAHHYRRHRSYDEGEDDWRRSRRSSRSRSGERHRRRTREREEGRTGRHHHADEEEERHNSRRYRRESGDGGEGSVERDRGERRDEGRRDEGGRGSKVGSVSRSRSPSASAIVD